MKIDKLLGVRGRSLRKMKTVAGPGIRHQEFRLRGIGFYLFAQAIDENAKLFQFVTVVRAPNGLQEFTM
jgi:hypothetical protein